MLKPALARGELHCVGATTLDEYRKHIEKDAALARRFQPVFVSEPTVEDTISILRGIKEKYELHHGVRITDGAIVAAATLVQPLHHRPLPARQGDRPDGRGGVAAAHGGRIEARGDRRARPPHHPAQDRARGAEEGERCRLEGSADEAGRGARGAREEIGRADRAVAGREGQARRRRRSSRSSSTRRAPNWSSAQRKGDWTPAGELTYGVIPELERKLKEAEAAESHRMIEEAVTDEHIAGVVSRWTGIPVDKMLEGEREKLLHMEDNLQAPRRRPGRGGDRGLERDPPRPRRACRIRTGRSARSCSSGRPASARPSSPRRSPSSCSTTRARWCASTCRNTWRSTRSRG